MARRARKVRVTGQQREHIDPHQIAQILLDLAGADMDRTEVDDESVRDAPQHDQKGQES